MQQPSNREGMLLVADPSPAYRELYADGHRGTVIEAEDAEEILEKAIAFSPDTLIIGVNFSTADLNELVWMLRLIRPAMRIVVCTEASAEELLKAGANACIPKSRLNASIREALYSVSPKEGV